MGCFSVYKCIFVYWYLSWCIYRLIEGAMPNNATMSSVKLLSQLHSTCNVDLRNVCVNESFIKIRFSRKTDFDSNAAIHCLQARNVPLVYESTDMTSTEMSGELLLVSDTKRLIIPNIYHIFIDIVGRLMWASDILDLKLDKNSSFSLGLLPSSDGEAKTKVFLESISKLGLRYDFHHLDMLVACSISRISCNLDSNFLSHIGSNPLIWPNKSSTISGCFERVLVLNVDAESKSMPSTLNTNTNSKLQWNRIREDLSTMLNISLVPTRHHIPKVIVIARESRNIINIDAIKSLCELEGFIASIEPFYNMSFIEQWMAILGADVVVSVHSGDLLWSLFVPDKQLVIVELLVGTPGKLSFGWYGGTYEWASSIRQHKHLVLPPTNISSLHPTSGDNWKYADLVVDTERLKPLLYEAFQRIVESSLQITGDESHQRCKYVEELHDPVISSLKFAAKHNKSMDRILIISGHGGPHTDTVEDLLEKGWPPQSLYSICMLQNCDLVGLNGGSPSGRGEDYWKNKTISGVELRNNVLKIWKVVDRYFNVFRNKGIEKSILEHHGNATHVLPDKVQQEFNNAIGNALEPFTAIILPYTGWQVVYFLDDKYSHLKIISRSAQRFHHGLPRGKLTSDFVRRIFNKIATNPSRYLVAAANAFDLIALKTIVSGRSGDCSDAKMYEPIVNISVLFWPGYYRQVRGWSPIYFKKNEYQVIEVGSRYNPVTNAKFMAWKKGYTRTIKESSRGRRWHIAEIGGHGLTARPELSHQNLALADLAIIHPYSTHSAKVNELYALGVPMIAPSLSLLKSLSGFPDHHLDMSPDFLRSVRPVLTCSNTSTSIDQWYMWADIYTHPFIFYFDSYDELTDRIDGIIDKEGLLMSTRDKMRLYWDSSYNNTSAVVVEKLDFLFGKD